MVELADGTAPSRQGTFFGEPRALAYLSFTEAWERFSYYGMAALLVLYMSQALFLPGRIGNVAGFATFRAGLESVFGPLSTLGLASQIYGLYTGFVYFTPVFGGLIADRWLGRRNAVILGAILMSAGHLAMAFDQSFLLALFLLIVGCGLLKGNISTQVGQLYAEDDGPGRTRGYSIFSMGINVGATLGPLICGLLAQIYGWHAGFGLAGILMLTGLATYLAGYRTLSEETPKANQTKAVGAPLDAKQWRVIGALVVAMALTVPQSVAYYQNSSIGLVWIDAHVNLDAFGFHIPTSWFNSIDPFISIVFVPVLIALWRWQNKHGGEPNEVMKISLGAWMAAIANFIVAVGCILTVRVPAIFPVIYDVLLGVAFLYYWPPLLALISRAAPSGLKATLIGAAFLSLFVGNILVGWVGTFYEHMTPANFWTLEGGIAVIGGVLAFLLAKPLNRVLSGVEN
ncbi:MAG TPA: peptide MFS transporter [Rhizomicrobium sp.]|jgi:POT family proton-dependent oligopeptide transporter